MKGKLVFYVTGQDDNDDHFKHDWKQLAFEISSKELARQADSGGYQQEVFDAVGRSVASQLAAFARMGWA